MNELNGTGITYPTLELAGVTYTLKFTRGGMLYRLGKTGTSISDMNAGGTKTIAAVVDVLHAALFGQFMGSPEDLANLLLEDLSKMREARAAIDIALGKVFPPSIIPAAATAGEVKPPVQ